MNCMKCGREIDDGQCFCPDCLLDMERYPVKPGTAVLLPKRQSADSQKKGHTRRKGMPSQEEQIKALKFRVRVLTAMVFLLLAMVAAMVLPAYRYFFVDPVIPGQNYSAAPVTDSASSD